MSISHSKFMGRTEYAAIRFVSMRMTQPVNLDLRPCDFVRGSTILRCARLPPNRGIFPQSDPSVTLTARLP